MVPVLMDLQAVCIQEKYDNYLYQTGKSKKSGNKYG